MMMIKAVISLLFVLFLCTQFVHCDYTAEIRIISYGNVKKMHRSLGSGGVTYCCCDCSGQPTCCSPGATHTCTRNCNTRALICIDDKYCVTSTYSTGGTDTFTSTAFGSLANPISINVPGAYPASNFQIKQLFRFHLYKSADDMSLIEEFNINEAVFLNRMYKNFTNDGVLVSLHHEIKIRCSDNYYGGDCSVYCKAYNDSTNGHYTCTSNGEKSCLAGYTNTSNNCLKRITVCREGCHPVGGYCTESNQCLCNSGWTGTNCSISTTCPSCTNGVCYEPNVCTCNHGWTGIGCNTPVCDPACNGRGGRCYSPNNCSCYEDWSGRLCDIPPSQPGDGTGTCSNTDNTTALLLLRILNTVDSINDSINDATCTCSNKDNATYSNKDNATYSNKDNATCSNKDNATALLSRVLSAVNSVSEANTADDDESVDNVAMYVSIINVLINIIIVLLLIAMCVLYFTRKAKQYDLQGTQLTKI